MQTIFGGNKTQSTSSSTNQAYPYLQGALSGTVGQGTAAGSQLANLLGLGGGAAQTDGFNKWKQSTGYQAGVDQGVQGIVGNNASKGLLNSGGTLKAIDTFGQDYASQKYQDYINPLQNLLGSGIQGAGVLAGAGNTSQSQSSGSEKPGISKFIGQLMAK